MHSHMYIIHAHVHVYNVPVGYDVLVFVSHKVWLAPATEFLRQVASGRAQETS